MTSSPQGWFTRWRDLIRRHPWTVAGVVGLSAAGMVVLLVWFQPQTLLFDQVVDEDFPLAGSPPATASEATDEVPTGDATDNSVASGDAEVTGDEDSGEMIDDDMDEDETVAASGRMALASGLFESRGRYSVTGTATVYEADDGTRLLRLEDFASTNGPDLFVYLTSADFADDDPALDSDFVNLGLLSGNIGNQNYTIDESIDLDHYDTVVIWCRRFTVGFGAADLEPTS
ncbi:hypothetical protein BH23ACT5_BH23ACT5_12750 [soil metagenome]